MGCHGPGRRCRLSAKLTHPALEVRCRRPAHPDSQHVGANGTYWLAWDTETLEYSYRSCVNERIPAFVHYPFSNERPPIPAPSIPPWFMRAVNAE